MTASSIENSWYVYLIRTSAGMLYTGISTDPERRLQEHSGTAKGAKSLRGKGPLSLAWQFQVADRSQASVLEARIKRMTRPQKERLVKFGWQGQDLP